MPRFEDFVEPSWMTRTSACRYFGLTDDDEGWDRLNELVAEFEIDCELGEVGDVLRVDGNDPGMKEALFTRSERLVGHRPDDPGKMAEARERVLADEDARRQHRQQDRNSRLAKRVAARKKMGKSRMEE